MDLDSAFKILELEKSVDISQIRMAYRDLAEIWHPDKYAYKPRLAEKAAIKMKEINLAYALIQEHLKSNRTSHKPSHEGETVREESFYFINCINCGAGIRVSNMVSNDNLRCGHCGKNPNIKESQSKSRTKCFDGTCNGMVSSDGRCFKCGKAKNDVEREAARHNEIHGAPHPWRRWFARSIDSLGGLLPYFFISISCELFRPGDTVAVMKKLGENPFISGIIVLALWVPVEAALLSTVGNTPARFLFGISVRTLKGRKLSFSQSLSRSFQVFLKGTALGVPFVAVFTEIFAYRRLAKTGTTLWDTAAGSVVHHKEWGAVRVIFCTLAVFLILFLTGITNDYQRHNSIQRIDELQSKSGSATIIADVAYEKFSKPKVSSEAVSPVVYTKKDDGPVNPFDEFLDPSERTPVPAPTTRATEPVNPFDEFLDKPEDLKHAPQQQAEAQREFDQRVLKLDPDYFTITSDQKFWYWFDNQSAEIRATQQSADPAKVARVLKLYKQTIKTIQ